MLPGKDATPPVARERHRVLPVFLLAVLSGAMVLMSCTVPPRLAAVLFEGVPPPGKETPPEPVVRHPRREAYKPPAPLTPPVVLAKVEEKPPPTDWSALFKKLPREEDGSVDWNDALKEKLIVPRPGIAPDAAEQTVFDYDVELVPAGLPAFKVVFPHKAHTQWLACINCHTEIFQMQRGADQITMAKVFAGEFCGRCHGKVSFALTSCARCHLAMPK